jgi:hypothetical protein
VSGRATAGRLLRGWRRTDRGRPTPSEAIVVATRDDDRTAALSYDF